MTPHPTARLLDITRLVSRLGRGPLTGVDRVELAYLEALSAADAPLFALVRTGLGFLLLDRNGAAQVLALVNGKQTLAPAGVLARAMRRGDPLRAQAEAAMRRLAIARAPGVLLGRMLRRWLPAGAVYLNTGHANLSARVMRAVKFIYDARIAVLVHDVIPLTHPEFTRPGIAAVFARKMAVVADWADLVIHTTHAARGDTETALRGMGRVPPGCVAPLGVTPARPDPTSLPPGLDLTTPYFITIGTIEPRKNHALLLDIWTQIPQARLFIVGSRGWADAALLARLDALKGPDANVIELPGLSDTAVAALLQGARALLFPTLAEGYGLPPIEAAAQHTPLIVSDLPVLHEVLGNSAVYLDPLDRYSWMETIRRLVANGPDKDAGVRKQFETTIPSWEAHFKIVLSLA